MKVIELTGVSNILLNDCGLIDGLNTGTVMLRRLLGFQSRHDLDGFLKQHGVWLEYSWQDLERDRETHEQLGP